MGVNFAKVAERAARQHGRVAWWQLIDDGVGRYAIQSWVEGGRLYPLHHGVYAVGHPGRSVLGNYMAAVLACGPGAVLSHRPAANLLRVMRGAPPPPEVTVATLAGRRREGIVIHRVKALAVADTTTWERIPIVTVPRVLLELAPTIDPPTLARGCHEAWIHHRTGPRQVEACIARNPTKPGAARLRRAMGSDVTLSELENGFLALLREHGLALPRTNVDHHGDKVDCHWPQLGLTVELLSFRFHGSRAAFEADVARRRRSNHLAFSYGDIFERGQQTIGELVDRSLPAARAGSRG
jgi:hypothetical protein